jgi:hypothetical protein
MTFLLLALLSSVYSMNLIASQQPILQSVCDALQIGDLPCDCGVGGPFHCYTENYIGAIIHTQNQSYNGVGAYVFSGVLATQIGLLSTLVQIQITSGVSALSVHGSIPSQIGLLTDMANLQLSGQALLSGTLPTQMSQLTGTDDLVGDFANIT